MADQSCDPFDGLPTWSFQEGEPITQHARAWQPLGVGHRCESWLAWSTTWWMPVVVKLARPHQVCHPRAQKAIGREADALLRCLHPTIPRLLTDGRDSDVPHLVEEYIDGTTLAETIDADGPLSAVDTLVLAGQLGAVVRYLHRRHLVHVDLKPDNVMLRDGRPVVIDLGSARALGRSQPLDGPPIGSPGYAAPELERGAPIAESMDLYGIGTILYEALTGQAAFDPELNADDRPSPESLSLPATVPPATAGLVRSLLEADPAKRPSSADDLLSRLDAQGYDGWPSWAGPKRTTAAAVDQVSTIGGRH
jgi:serine/threonine protein kinase